MFWHLGTRLGQARLRSRLRHGPFCWSGTGFRVGTDNWLHWWPLLQLLCWFTLLLRFPWCSLDELFHMSTCHSMTTRSPLLETTLCGSGSYVADNLFSFCLLNRTLSPSDTSDSTALLFTPSALLCLYSASLSHAFPGL